MSGLDSTPLSNTPFLVETCNATLANALTAGGGGVISNTYTNANIRAILVRYTSFSPQANTVILRASVYAASVNSLGGNPTKLTCGFCDATITPSTTNNGIGAAYLCFLTTSTDIGTQLNSVDNVNYNGAVATPKNFNNTTGTFSVANGAFISNSANVFIPPIFKVFIQNLSPTNNITTRIDLFFLR